MCRVGPVGAGRAGDDAARLVGVVPAGVRDDRVEDRPVDAQHAAHPTRVGHAGPDRWRASRPPRGPRHVRTRPLGRSARCARPSAAPPASRPPGWRCGRSRPGPGAGPTRAAAPPTGSRAAGATPDQVTASAAATASAQPTGRKVDRPVDHRRRAARAARTARCHRGPRARPGWAGLDRAPGPRPAAPATPAYGGSPSGGQFVPGDPVAVRPAGPARSLRGRPEGRGRLGHGGVEGEPGRQHLVEAGSGRRCAGVEPPPTPASRRRASRPCRPVRRRPRKPTGRRGAAGSFSPPKTSAAQPASPGWSTGLSTASPARHTRPRPPASRTGVGPGQPERGQHLGAGGCAGSLASISALSSDSWR